MARRSSEVAAAATPDVRALVAERAYYKAEQRGFTPGNEIEDWLAAEREVAVLVDEPPAETAKKPAKRKSATIKKLKTVG
jgi:hypothetical protein